MTIVPIRSNARRVWAANQFRHAHPRFMDNLRDLRERRSRELRALANSSGRDQRSMVRKLLRDRSLHVLYAYDAIRRAHGLHRVTPQIVYDVATRCNVFAPVRDERAITRFVRKGSGNRWVQDFGPRRRMQQALVADILRHIHPRPRTQTLFNGGMPAALEAVATACREGATHGMEVDLVNFYPSIRPDGLADLLRPLPTSVVEHVVWDVALRDDPRLNAAVVSDADPTPSPLTGLSLGASTSPIVGECIIARLLAAAQLPSTITYSDNLFVTGRSEAEVLERIHRLRESAASLREVSELGLRVGYSFHGDLSKPFEFLKREGEATSEGFVWKPSAAKIEQYQVSAAERQLSHHEITSVERRIRNWRRSYPNWEHGDVLEADFLAGLAARRFYLTRSAANLTAAVHAVIVAIVAYNSARPAEELIPTEGDPAGDGRARLLHEVRRWIEAAGARQHVA